MPYTAHKKHTFFDIARRTAFISLGAWIFAYGLEAVLIPNKIIDGGITGISLMLSHLTHIPLGIFLFILNIPFFILGYKQIGKTFLYSMIYGVAVVSIATTALHHTPQLFKDPILATVFGGILLGAGIGLVIRSGGVLDGSETLAILIEKKSPFTVGEIILFINIIIFAFAILVYDIKSALYSLLTYYIAFKTIDIVVKGFDDMKSVHIISDHHEDIASAISNRLGRGVTYLHGEGAYTNEEKKVIMCVFTRLEEAKMKDIIQDIDENAFIIITDIAEVRGKGFKKKDIH